MLLAFIVAVATAPPPPPALPIVVGRGTTPADVGTTGARPTTVEPALETVTAAVAAAGDERGRLQMLWFELNELDLTPTVAAAAAAVGAGVFGADDVFVEAVLDVVVVAKLLLAMLLMEFVARFVVVLEDDDVAQWSGNSHGPSL